MESISIQLIPNKCINVTNGVQCGMGQNWRFPGQTPQYCKRHSQKGMVPTRRDKCTHETCTKVPNFGMLGQRPTRCKAHKTEQMIDVKSVRCRQSGCTKQPNFNSVGQTKGIYCQDHRQQGMIDVKMPRCQHQGCVSQPTHGHSNTSRPIYCGTHSEVGMYNVNVRKCNGDLCTTQANMKYDGYCARCHAYYRPDHVLSRQFKLREQHVIGYIINHIQGKHQYTADRQVGQSRRRPDLLIPMQSYNVIVECDEDQHKAYDPQCEVTRLHQIFEDLRDKPMVVIRFNPDVYKEGIVKHRSAFKINRKTGLSAPDIKEFISRMTKLVEVVDKWTGSVDESKFTNQLLYVEYLFFDTE